MLYIYMHTWCELCLHEIHRRICWLWLFSLCLCSRCIYTCTFMHKASSLSFATHQHLLSVWLFPLSFGSCQISSEIMGVLGDISIYQPTVPQPCRHLMIPVVGMKLVVLAQWSADLPFPLQVSGSTPHGIARCTTKVMSQVLSLHELTSPRLCGCVRYPPRSWGCSEISRYISLRFCNPAGTWWFPWLGWNR